MRNPSFGSFVLVLLIVGSFPACSTAQDKQATKKKPELLQVFADADPSDGPAPLTVQFECESLTPTKDPSYKWDFGDGSSGKGSNPKHTYKKQGKYSARCEVTAKDGSGAGDDITTIEVEAPE